jgi:hypothetical protein
VFVSVSVSVAVTAVKVEAVCVCAERVKWVTKARQDSHASFAGGLRQSHVAEV